MNLRRLLCFSLACVVICSGVFSVSAYASDMVEIDISDYVLEKEYSGDDVLVTYDLPVKPYTDIYGFKSGETTPKFITSTGNLYFYQDTIDETWSYFDECWDFSRQDCQMDSNGAVYFYDWEIPSGFVPSAFTHLLIDGVMYSLDWLTDTHARIEGYDTQSADIYVGNLGWFSLEIEAQLDDICFGYLVDVYDVAEYQRISGATWALGIQNGNPRVIDISDIRSGYGFNLDFNVRTYINIDGQISTPSSTYTAYWLDADYELMRTSSHAVDYTDIEFEDGTSINFSIPFTVPEGAEYFYVRFNTGYFDVNECWEVSWEVRSVRMQATLSAIEDNSKTMQRVTSKLNQISNKLDATQQEEVKQTGLLQNIVSDIKELPSQIANEIKEATKELFIPDAQDIADQKDQWDDLLADRFGAVYEAGSIANDIAEAFVPGEKQEIINFPATSFDLAGAEFVFGGWEIDVVPDGFDFAIDTLKMIINIACTLLFVNALKNRFENTLDGDD